MIVLGRGENEEKVRLWLSVAARTPGVIGFAVGRTVFWDALKQHKESKLSREKAVAKIATNNAINAIHAFISNYLLRISNSLFLRLTAHPANWADYTLS